MRILEISIKNYRSCIDTTFAPEEHLSVLIGPNGSGKTNVLSALRLLPTLCNPTHAAADEPITSASELRVVYDVDGARVIQAARLSLVTNEKNQDEITNAEQYWIVPAVTGPRRKIRIPLELLSQIRQYRYTAPSRLSWSRSHRDDYVNQMFASQGIDKEVLPILYKVADFVMNISYYSASQFTNPGSSPISFEVEREAKRRIGISITGHKKLLFDIYQEHRTKSDVYKEFIGLVGASGIGLIDNIDFDEIQTSSSSYSVMTGGNVVKREKTNLLVVPSFKISGDKLSPSQLSEGTFKTLALIFYLVTDKSSLLMIEEPEVCVHHGLLSSIVELIKTYSRDKQIIISTHSDAVLDKVSIENVFKVRRPKNKGSEVSSIRRNMSARELSALKDYLSNEGSLGEYWKHGDLEKI